MNDIMFNENTRLIQLHSLRAASNNSYDNAANVVANVYDEANALIAGPTTLIYVAASNGDYENILASTAANTVNAKYKIVVDATSSGGLKGRWTKTYTAKTRGNI